MIEPDEIEALLGEIRSMAIAWDDEDVTDEDCHYARHALRVTKGDRTLYSWICFDCGNSITRGLPEAAKPGANGLHHFKDELRDLPEWRLTENGVACLKAPGIE